MKKTKNWAVLFLSVLVLCLVPVVGLAVYLDPYMHYHSPRLTEFRYEPKVQRSVNDGMVKRLSYDALVLGTCMVENTKTSQLDSLFGCHSIKTPSIGAGWWEISGLEKLAFRYNPQLSLVVRGLDMTCFDEEPQALHYEIGPYPTYLYNESLLDDVYYVFNRDVLYGDCLGMLLDRARGVAPGLSNLDDYGAWGPGVYGKSVAMHRSEPYRDAEQLPLSEAERALVLENVKTKVTDLADSHPEARFYYFLTPYSAAWWGDLRQEGKLRRQLEMEELVIRAILPHENIHLFSFNTVEALTLDLANYKDRIHYGPWVNDWILRQMAAGSGRLTEENVDGYLASERSIYESFDYNSLFDQPDPSGEGIPEFFRQ